MSRQKDNCRTLEKANPAAKLSPVRAHLFNLVAAAAAAAADGESKGGARIT